MGLYFSSFFSSTLDTSLQIMMENASDDLRVLVGG
jgi:hypothetical protein